MKLKPMSSDFGYSNSSSSKRERECRLFFYLLTMLFGRVSIRTYFVLRSSMTPLSEQKRKKENQRHIRCGMFLSCYWWVGAYRNKVLY
jgi:hypothetical protein